MEDRERHREPRVAQVRVERRELVGRAERLVGDRAERERRDVRPGTRSARRRARYARRSASSSADAERPQEHELLDPSAASPRAVSPSASSSTGTGRQPAVSIPSAAQAASIPARAASSRRNTIASPHHGPGTSDAGIGSSTPAPSPVLPSAAYAPRWRIAREPLERRVEDPRATAGRPRRRRSRCRRSRVQWEARSEPTRALSNEKRTPACLRFDLAGGGGERGAG